MFLTGCNFSVNRLEKIIILLCASFVQTVLFTTWTEGRVLAFDRAKKFEVSQTRVRSIAPGNFLVATSIFNPLWEKHVNEGQRNEKKGVI